MNSDVLLILVNICSHLERPGQSSPTGSRVAVPCRWAPEPKKHTVPQPIGAAAHQPSQHHRSLFGGPTVPPWVTQGPQVS